MSTSSKYFLASHFDAITSEFRVIQIYESFTVVEKDTYRYGRLVGNSLSRCQCSFQNSYLMYLRGNNYSGRETPPRCGTGGHLSKVRASKSNGGVHLGQRARK